MKKLTYHFLLCILIISSCSANEQLEDESILGFELLNDLNGHWVGKNETAFGTFDWFAFDFRPISSSHCHSIYEGATNQNIITSVFVADFEGKQQIMARNGGWLGNQYRATYFVLDAEENSDGVNHYRLVDAIGGVDRAFIEFRFSNDSIFIDAYKDNSGSLDKPIHHMGFEGTNRNPTYSLTANERFDYPKQVSEVDLNGKFIDLVDNDSALFLEEESDPFPESNHAHISQLTIDIARNIETMDAPLLLFLSKEPIVDESGNVDFVKLDDTVIRTISIRSSEESYTATYLHPDQYYLTVFSDMDGNSFPSSGDYTSMSTLENVQSETFESTEVEITILIN